MSMPHDGEDRVKNLLIANFSSSQTRCLSLEPRDSKNIDEPYRLEMARQVIAAPEEKVLITHGTDALLETAAFFHSLLTVNPPLQKKHIVFIGAMVPLANGPASDGYGNLAFALSYLSSVKTSPPSVGLVLCGFDSLDSEIGEWQPHYYPFLPNTYEKYYHPSDSRFNRLKIRKKAVLTS